MKRWLTLLLAALMLFTACACADLPGDANAGDANAGDANAGDEVFGGATPADAMSDEETIAALTLALEEARLEIERLRAELDTYENPGIVARYNGGEIYAGQVMEQFEQIALMYELFYDYDITLDPEECASIQKDIIMSLAISEIIDQKLEAAGVTLLSDDELLSLKDEASRAYTQLLEENMAYFRFADTDEAAVREATIEFLKSNGYDEDTLYAEYVEEARQDAVIQYIAGDITLTQEQIEEAYQLQLDADESFYSQSPEEYEYEAMYDGASAAWIPEGYRRIRVLLIALDDAALFRLDDLRAQLVLQADSAEIARLNAEIDAYYDALNERVDTVRARLGAGESFDRLLAEFGGDPAMASEPYATEGYLIYKDSFYFEESIAEAAMALENVGDVSDAVRGEYGYNFIEYLAPVNPGPVPLEDMFEQVSESALDALKFERYQDIIDEWLEEANLVYYLDRLN